MLHLIDPGLDTETSLRLSGYQGEVDAACTYAEQVEAGKDLFVPLFRQCAIQDSTAG